MRTQVGCFVLLSILLLSTIQFSKSTKRSVFQKNCILIFKYLTVHELNKFSQTKCIWTLSLLACFVLQKLRCLAVFCQNHLSSIFLNVVVLRLCDVFKLSVCFPALQKRDGKFASGIKNDFCYSEICFDLLMLWCLWYFVKTPVVQFCDISINQT